jgi:hypothetical protein
LDDTMNSIRDVCIVWFLLAAYVPPFLGLIIVLYDSIRSWLSKILEQLAEKQNKNKE